MSAITEKGKWAVDFNALDNHQEADIKSVTFSRSVKLRECEDAKSPLKYFLTKLNRQELIELVETCKSYEEQTVENLSCWTFVSNAIEYLHNKGKIVEGEKKKCLRKLDELKTSVSEDTEKFKEKMHDENCTEASTGWYHNRDTGRVGIAILMNGKNKFVMEFGIFDEDRLRVAQRVPPRGLVTIQNWSDSTCFYKGTLATLDYRTLIEFTLFCKSCEVDHNYNKKTQN